jgi:hypothetical protein
VYAVIPRAGLGNCLFPWARAIARSYEWDARLLPPVWLQARVGPWLRRERDRRSYSRLFRRASVWARVEATTKLLVAERLDEQAAAAQGGPDYGQLVVIEGMTEGFSTLWPHRTLIGASFLASLKSAQPSCDLKSGSYTAIHVRRGDFNRVLDVTSRNRLTPIGWYTKQLGALRSGPGRPMATVVCSDGTDEELAELLSIPNVCRAASAGAAADLLTLSRASVILGSSSTFSAWGFFLGHGQLVLPEGCNHYLAGVPNVSEAS